MQSTTHTVTLPKVTRHLHITAGNADDYHRLARWHYRDNGSIGPYAAIYSLRQSSDFTGTNANRLVGVIVYTMPTTGCSARDIATGGFFSGLSRADRIALLNRHFRRISRVIIEPRYRGCGLASILVSKTMPLLNVTYIEALAVMGNFNPFFEKAGLSPYPQGIPQRNKLLLEALSLVGVEQSMLDDVQAVQQKLACLNSSDKAFIDRQLCKFTGAFGKRRFQSGSPQRTEWILSKLSLPPVYYIWFNPKKYQSVIASEAEPSVAI
jgi:hypothetical protein